MDPDDLRALLRRLHREGDASTEPFVGRRLARQRADGPLAARADKDWAAEDMKQRQPVHQLEIVPDRLTEAESGIDDDFRSLDPGRNRRFDPLLKPLINLD